LLVTASRPTYSSIMFLRKLVLFKLLLLFSFVLIFFAITLLLAALLLYIKITFLFPAMDPTENRARCEVYFILFSECVADTVYTAM